MSQYTYVCKYLVCNAYCIILFLESKVSSYGSMSESCESDRLDIAIELVKIVKCSKNSSSTTVLHMGLA